MIAARRRRASGSMRIPILLSLLALLLVAQLGLVSASIARVPLTRREHSHNGKQPLGRATDGHEGDEPYDFDAPRPIRHLSLRVGEKTIWSDCNPMFGAHVINGTSPGPALRVRAGERLLINVTNELATDVTTVHWHGLSMRLNPASDGTPMISQWPIKPGESFLYDIRLSRKERGTYFYHTHVALGSMTAYGALIIEDPLPPASYDVNSEVWGDADLHASKGRSEPDAPYRYDEDRILALGDYWSMTSEQTIAGQLTADPFVWPGSPKSLLMNGKQRAECNATALAAQQMKCPTNQPADQPLCDYDEIRLAYGKTYRLRVIGSQTLMYLSLGLLNHTIRGGNGMELIEADGSYLSPLPTDHVEIAPGQRYSWLVHAKSRNEVKREGQRGIYWARIESRYRAGPSGWVRIVYEDEEGKTLASRETIANAQPPNVAKNATLLPVEKVGWILDRLSPLPRYAPRCPPDEAVDRTIIIEGQQHLRTPGGKAVQWWENGKAYSETTATPIPYLVALYEGKAPRPSLPWAFSSQNPANNFAQSGLFTPTELASQAEVQAAQMAKWMQGFDDKSGLYLLREGEVVDIIIINKPSATSQNVEVHPWHLHSSKHWTRTTQAGTFSFQKYLNVLASQPLKRGGGGGAYANPIPRDTTTVYPSPGAAYLNQTVPDPADNDGGWSVLRYKVHRTNAGVFPLHCHITFHLQMGMAVVLGIDVEEFMKPGGKLDSAFGGLPASPGGSGAGAYEAPKGGHDGARKGEVGTS